MTQSYPPSTSAPPTPSSSSLPPPSRPATTASSASTPSSSSGNARSTTSLEAEELHILINSPEWEDELQLLTYQNSTAPDSLVNCFRSARRLTAFFWAHPVKTYIGMCLLAFCFAVFVRWLGGGWNGSNHLEHAVVSASTPRQR
ncbi:hypothetical protein MVLG_00674 [Microbotryum lychnidis-dioicae p1A1 Lamole]|uniref:Uncharacterized protein n=1 Tax=Microbotryum lychnidis-dioicae (strain p1A1 Lamole / MvSl-1064) TaxID=683840 RepID=U5GZS8_USTV1|nr:hypothetical protein MVLG_00674 [Microbotryum lychnidis-dioicae p1A1 Lamole]|eukprot:KDE09360.1 hypothetical protein MVLG_00674 [Microbotryum lychnidis-dioicae p1A1 Lamole]